MASERVADDALALLHFAFREIVREPDATLAELGLARPHHRILYMCRRNDGVTVAELLRILEVTKQALSGPLRDLTLRGFIDSTIDPADRRSRQLRLTLPGRELEFRLSEVQRRRFATVFRGAGASGTRAWCEVMRSLADGKSEESLRSRAPHQNFA
jgi:DNA-binding MarR family transcriptional regulator